MKQVKKYYNLVLENGLQLNKDIVITNDNKKVGAASFTWLELMAYLTGLELKPAEIEDIVKTLGSKDCIVANLFDKVEIVCPSDLRTTQGLILKKEYGSAKSIKMAFQNQNQAKLYEPSAKHNTSKKYVLDIKKRSIKPITAKIYDKIDNLDKNLGKIEPSEKIDYRIERIKLAKMYYKKLNK